MCGLIGDLRHCRPANSTHEPRRLYVVSVDIERCYDNIDVHQLLHIMGT